MQKKSFEELFNNFSNTFEGEVFSGVSRRLMYATDASVYREIPLGVVYPRSTDDITKIIRFASENSLTIIPRGAGTSLAGQVVGNGVVADISRYMNNVLEINAKEKWVRVQPGVVLDELNLELKKTGLFFAPETSTSNRCVIGGMIGNNSSGSHSLIYGTTREHLLSVKAILSDGSEVEFSEITKDEFEGKCKLDSPEGQIYRQINVILSDPSHIEEIDREYPDKRIIRRNTGYALDELSDCSFFRKESNNNFNFCKLLAGSEGTLAFITEAKLRLTELPPTGKALVCVHVNSVNEAIKANLIALEHNPSAVELMDKKILDLTAENIEQNKNRFFIKGDPGAILIVEFFGDSMEGILQTISTIEQKLRSKNLGYHFPIITGQNINKVWNLRKAGLGVLSNMKGDAKPVSVIEDTSVHPEKLEQYISEFNLLLKKYNLNCVYHAHISVGELHLRPVLNLKDSNDVVIFRNIAEDTARLVKKYKGSLSGEHGDGRVRGEFIPLMYNSKIYSWFREIKKTWDPYGIFNYGKITDVVPFDKSFRHTQGQQRELETLFDFSDTEGILRAVEKCNGSGDCRKGHLMGGTMCPSYMATKDEKYTTRARANILREYLTNSGKQNAFNHKEIYDVMDNCLACKGCKSECPSNLDIAKLKSEFLYQYYRNHFIPLRTKAIAYITALNRVGALAPVIYNFFVSNPILSGIIKKLAGFAAKRRIPILYKETLQKWIQRNMDKLNDGLPSGAQSVYFFIDEFTNYNDTLIGIKTILLLNKLGYRIFVSKNTESGRTFISKGLLLTARKKAMENVQLFSHLVGTHTPLIGIEPSAILSFRDEYPDLLRGEMKEKSRKIAENTLLIDEFLSKEMDAGRINKDMFTKEVRKIKLHVHCQQKAVASSISVKKILSFPENYTVEEIASGCCGMAGSFGFEKEHYALSMKVGELVLFPEVRKAGEDIIIAANGTSCRQQIKDGTGKDALHPVEILYAALKE